jgi:hypothetical protein
LTVFRMDTPPWMAGMVPARVYRGLIMPEQMMPA